VSGVGTKGQAPLRARAILITALALAAADLLETVAIVWPGSAQSHLGAPGQMREVLTISAVIAVVLAVLLVGLYRLRSTRWYPWIAALGFVALALCSLVLLWTGHLLTLLLGLAAFGVLIFLTPERAAFPDEGPVLPPSRRSR